MDPALKELLAEGAPGDEVAIIVRLNPKAKPPSGLRIVARFGTIATARATREDLSQLHASPALESVKASRTYASEAATEQDYQIDETEPDAQSTDNRRPEGVEETGKGSVVAVIDWGCDFAHPDFRRDDGGTRLIALWDQRAQGDGGIYGYGAIHRRKAIDSALASDDPFAAIGYAPGPSIPAHGTHVLGIAAGNGRAGGPLGVAPSADIIFCHLGTGGDLGSSIELLEAIHFAAKTAGSRPLAINLSIGRHAGPHDGTLLIEQAIDWLLANRVGTAVVQSTGNYFSRDVHMSGQLREGQQAELPFRLGRRDKTPISIETWYCGADEFDARVFGPNGVEARAALGTDVAIVDAAGAEVGHLYHRRRDPNNRDNLLNLFLYEPASSGEWRIELEGIDVVDGRWHSWIERNAACRACQAQFLSRQADSSSTTGSICNALRTIAVGAYDAHVPDHRLAPFSSVGPTRDGRRKPLLVAPGVRVLSVRSRADAAEAPGYIRMSGTSMAAPHVTGTLALMMEAAGRQRISALRHVLFSTLAPVPEDQPRWGYGRLDIGAAVEASRALRPDGQLSRPERASDERVEAMTEPDDLGLARQQPVPVTNLLTHLIGQEATEAETAHVLRTAIDPADPSAAMIGWPGRRLSLPLEPGDLILREIGSGGSQLALVADPTVLSRSSLAALRLFPEGPWPGRYVQVVERNSRSDPFAWRIAGPDGFVLPDVSILRLNQPGEAIEPAPGPHSLIRKGSTGPAVAEAQSKFNRIHAGWISEGLPPIEACPLEIDGKFGAATEKATRSFQRKAFPAQPSEWDGVIGPKTWSMIELHALGLPIVPPVPVPLPHPPTPIIPVSFSAAAPVIVLPGIMGTRLRLGGAKLPDWDPDSIVAMGRWLAQKGDDKLKGFDFRNPATILDDHKDSSRQRRGWGTIAQRYYKPLLEGLEKELATPSPCAQRPLRHPVWAFGYDWRQSNASHASRLSQFIDLVLRTESAQQVILVTHSMGGLVARAALPLIERKVMGIVHCVQPSVGAVVAARRVHTGYEPSIDGDLGELLQEMAEAFGVDSEQVEAAMASDGDPAEVGMIENRLQTALFGNSLFAADPIYYGRLMACQRGAVELLPSDQAGIAKADWLRPSVPAGSIYDHYKTAPIASGGLILPKLPAADAAEFKRRIDEAKAFHSGLRYHDRTGVLFATELKTDNAFDPAAKNPAIIERRGDGTVPAFSARCPDLHGPLFRAGFPKVNHGECFKDAIFLKATIAGVDHIAQGQPALPPDVAPDRQSCIAMA